MKLGSEAVVFNKCNTKAAPETLKSSSGEPSVRPVLLFSEAAFNDSYISFYTENDGSVIISVELLVYCRQKMFI